MPNNQDIELSSSFVHGDFNRAYTLNIVEHHDASGKYSRKLGIVECRLRLSTGRWRMLKRRHTFIPLEAWPQLMALSDTVAHFAKYNQGSHLVGKRNAPSVQDDKVPESDVGERTMKNVQKECLYVKSETIEPSALPQMAEKYPHYQEPEPRSIKVCEPQPLTVRRKRVCPPANPPRIKRRYVKKIKGADVQASLDVKSAPDCQLQVGASKVGDPPANTNATNQFYYSAAQQ
jgi:hypothetical protein